MPNVVKVHLVLLAIAVAASLPLYPYQWHKLLHIFGAIVFLGNIIVTAVWMALAQITRDPAVIHFAARSVSRADLFFYWASGGAGAAQWPGPGRPALGRLERVSQQ